MKSITCRELGGACDKEFLGNTFQEVAEQSRAHGIEMMETGDKDHLKAMEEMKKLMESPEAMSSWMEDKERLFNSKDDKP